MDQKFEFIQQIGQGAYGYVLKAYDKTRKEMVALKFFKDQKKGVSQSTLRELSHLNRLKGHQNIIKIIEIIPNFNIKDQSFFVIVLELMEYDLHQAILKNLNLDIKNTFKQILNGVQYIHSHSIIHRDLKPQNILVKGNLIKIADFGLSRNYQPDQQLTEDVATLWYKAPETLLGFQFYTLTMDMWGIGCIFYEIAMKKPLFQGETKLDMLYNIFKTFGTPEEQFFKQYQSIQFPQFKPSGIINDLKLNQNFVDLLKKLLNLDQKKRISAEQALKHPYFID